MINISNIGVKYGDRTLLNNVSLSFKLGHRVGLIGRNGAGKSTLLKIIGGQLIADSGSIQIPKGYELGYLKQEIDFTSDKSILEETLSCFAEVVSIHKELESLNVDLTERTDYESDSYTQLLEKVSELTERLSILDSGDMEGSCVKVLKGLGFKEAQLQQSILTLSGGWKMRVELAKLLLQQPQLLLLDEPTNHLDIESIIWLETYLSSYPGTVLLISHDTRFLNNVCNRIIEIELGRTLDIMGNYEKFKTEKVSQREITQNAFLNQQKVIAQKERTITRFMAKASKTKMAQSMKNQLDKMERIEVVGEDNSEMKLKFNQVPRSSRVIAKLEGIDKAYDDNKVLQDLSIILERGEKIAFVGQNGQGKTTLARIIAGDLEVSDGDIERGENIYQMYYAQNQTDILDRKKTVLEVAEENCPPDLRSRVRKILGSFLFSGEDVEKKISVLSGGEKARLALACMIMHPTNLIILDEPTNHLDIQAKEILKNALIEYEGALIVVSHDRSFLSGLTDKTYEFKNKKIGQFLGDVDYFLEKRKLEDLREAAVTKQPLEKKGAKQEHQDNADQKKWEKKLKYCERDIEKIEDKIAKVEEGMAQVTDFNSDRYVELSKQYTELKDDLAKKMLEWEGIAEKLM